MSNKIIKEIRLFLDSDETQHLYLKSEDTEDLETLTYLLQRAKKIYSKNLSETESLINKIKTC